MNSSIATKPELSNYASPRIAFAFYPTPWWKRGMDVVGALSLLLLLAPVLVLIAVVIKSTSRGPVLFKQSRVGARGKPFTIWKFRTMVSSVETDEHREYVKQLSSSDQPLTKPRAKDGYVPFGGLLRKTGLDELPQLVNILRGDMSFIGPRPDVLSLADYEPWQAWRFGVVPGVTGLWQVSGKNSTTFDEMTQLDLDYIARRSLWLDLKILFSTIPVIVGQLRDDPSGAGKR